MASIIMYEMLTTIPKHPILLTAAEIQRLPDGGVRKVDEMISDSFRACRVNNGRHPNNVRHFNANNRTVTLRKERSL